MIARPQGASAHREKIFLNNLIENLNPTLQRPLLLVFTKDRQHRSQDDEKAHAQQENQDQDL